MNAQLAGGIDHGADPVVVPDVIQANPGVNTADAGNTLLFGVLKHEQVLGMLRLNPLLERHLGAADALADQVTVGSATT